jgi:cathepsin H
MMKRAFNFMFASYASACITCNTDFAEQLNGKEELQIDVLYQRFIDEGNSVVDLNEPGRYETFGLRVIDIVNHNSDETQTFKRGLNRHSAMSYQELKDYYKMDKVNDHAKQNCSATKRANGESYAPLGDVPDTWNWREHNGVSPVKDQGSCGSCWTFSTVGCLESAHLIKYGSLATYSEQQLVDCAGAFENHGCNGGLPSQAFEYVMYNGGLASETSYPYFGEDRNCTVSASDYIIDVDTGAVNITADDEEELKDAVYNYGPTSVCFEVVDDFSSYTSGVYTSTTCGNTQQDVNHAVLAVGYGTDSNGMKYWIVKNSWGTSWGDEGFFMIERGVNMCGIAMCNSHPSDVTQLPSGAAQFLQ